MACRKGSDAYYRKLAKAKLYSKAHYQKRKALNVYHPELLKTPYKPCPTSPAPEIVT
jgi:hypothetical protein